MGRQKDHDLNDQLSQKNKLGMAFVGIYGQTIKKT
jgi:hypothetical protein